MVLVPVLGRPQNVAPLLESFAQSTPEAHRVLFLCDPGDTAEQDAIAAVGGWMLSPGGSYAAKINVGVRVTDEPLLLLAADDIRPHPGWLDAARAAMLRTGAQVVGLEDLIPRPHRPGHATHFLMTREYAELPCIDGSPGPLFEGYAHWRTDDELIATATARGCYVYVEDAIVEHLHPMVQKAPDDHVYERGRANARLDGKRFKRREHLWT